MNLFQWRSNNVFEVRLRAHSMAACGAPELDDGGKILLPPSALDTLSRLQIGWPVFFSLRSSGGKSTHAGVQQFTAEEGTAGLPYWMMRQLGLAEGAVLAVRQVELLPGSFAKIQPHSKDFLDISNPRAVLEKHLRDYACMTVGDTFQFTYNEKKFAFNVLELRPGSAVSIVETDMNVDFAPPLDYVEPAAAAPAATAQQTKGTEKKAAGKNDGGGLLQPDVHVVPTLVDPLAGTTANRLGGKKSKTEPVVAVPPPPKTRLTLGTSTAALAPPPAATATASAPEKKVDSKSGAAASATAGAGMSEAEMRRKKEEYWASLGSGNSLKKK